MAKNTAGMRGKDDERKLFLGGLPKQCSESDIRNVLAPFGEIESINIKMDPYTGQPRGFCFVVFTDTSMVEKVLSSGDVTINGKKVDPRKVTKTLIPGKIFIGGVTPELTEEKVKEFFGQFGTITEVQWPFDKVKNQRRPYMFLTFENRDTVSDLLRTPKQTVHGVELDVKKVKFNPETMWQPGMYGGPAGRGGRGGGFQGGAYGAAPYNGYGYDYGRGEEYGYDDYSGMECGDGWYDGYTGYEYAPYPAYTPRPPRGGRNTGGYVRHAPY